MSFRKYQAIIDLRRIAIRLLENVPETSLARTLGLQDKLKTSLSEEFPNWELNLSKETWEAVCEMVWKNNGDQSDLLAANCVMLLDRFEHPERGGDFTWEWERLSPLIWEAEPSVRAALMNGLHKGRQFSVVSEDIKTSAESRVSKPLNDVLPPLIALAKSMTETQRKEVAQSDYGENVEKHLQALNALLASETCHYPKGDYWYPAEVVELTANVADNSGFSSCTAIVLINAIDDGNHMGMTELRWRSKKYEYQQLDKAERSAILNGFRYLYETDENWDPYFDAFAPQKLRVESFLLLSESS